MPSMSRCRRVCALVIAAAAAASPHAAATGTASPIAPPAGGAAADRGLPNFDIRFDQSGSASPAVRAALDKVAPDPDRAAAARDDLDRVRIVAPDAVIDLDPVLRTPRFLRSTSRFLSEPRPGAAADAIVRDFVANHGALFELAEADIDEARIVRDFKTEHNGVTHLTYLQQIDGIEVFHGELHVNIARAGEIITISSTMVPRPHAPTKPVLTAAQAIVAAARSVGIEVTADPTPGTPPDGAGEMQRWNRSPDFRSDRDVVTRRVYFPLTRTDLRAAYFVIIPVHGVGHTYNIVVDAVTGEALFRGNELCFEAIRAYPGRSPRPGPFGAQYPFASRRLITVGPTAASPFGWWDTNGVAGPEFNDTRGNNVDAHLDLNADNVADLPRPIGVGSPLRFDTPLNHALGPTSWRDAAIINGFYLVNVFHDRLYNLGFTPAAGNFQTNNYGLGGLGNDAVQLDCQDGSGTNNANFGTPADGTAPRCQMFIYTTATPNRDSSLDAEILFHECTHGVSNRLTGGPANATALNSIQSGGMGEGWSDFVAMSLLSEMGENPGAAYPAGTYAINNGAGIRRFPYSSSMGINPLTVDAYGTTGTTSYGVARSTSVHNTGEIWCSCLWDCRAAMIQAQGFAANDTFLRLVLDGMKLQPANPSFTQARDAILAADIALTGGANHFRLWTAFARRGLGVGATTAGSTATTVTQAFDVPEGPDAGELPASAAVVAGISGGALSRISGTLATGNVDLYRINICDRAVFSASTVGLAAFNTQLFLFDSTGQPVVFNDDASATTQSTITGASVPSNGEYYLAISGADRDPVSAFGDIWLDAPTTTQRTPDGPGAGPARPITGWSGTDATTGGAYAIQLAGACASGFGTIPVEPRALSGYGSPDPNTFSFGVGGTTVIRVYVEPATVPASSGIAVTVDAAALGLGTLVLLDNGSAPDTTAGDRVFAAQAGIPTTLAAGQHDLPLHIADGQGRAFDSAVLLTVIDPVGACCVSGSTCVFQTASACAAQFGQNKGAGLTCDPAPCIAGTESEPNNTSSTADDGTRTYAAFAGSRYHMGFAGSVATSTDADYINIGSLQVGDVLSVSQSGSPSMRGTNTDCLVRLYRSGTGTIVASDDDGGPGLDALIWRFPISVSDIYYVRPFRANTTNTGTYQIGINLDDAPATAAPVTGGIFTAEVEPNESTAAANNASASWRRVQYVSSMSGSLSASDIDIFRYQFSAGDLVTLLSSGFGVTDTRLSLLNSAGTVLASEDGSSAGPDADSPILSYIIPTTGTYYARVQPTTAADSGPYLVTVYLSTGTPPTLACPPDFNNSGVLSVQDIFDFLAAYFLGDIAADFNRSGALSVQDIFDYLAAYFAGCA